MGVDRDILILGWLNRQPAGYALAKDIPLAGDDDLRSLEQRGLICRVPGKEPERERFVITPEGKHFQEGD